MDMLVPIELYGRDILLPILDRITCHTRHFTFLPIGLSK